MATTDIEVRGPTIRLGQLLKLSGLAGSGGEVRPMLGTGEVTVNGTVEIRRGRQLRHGDVVAVGGTRVRLVVAGGAATGPAPTGDGRSGPGGRLMPWTGGGIRAAGWCSPSAGRCASWRSWPAVRSPA